jgi:tetratricopeptide (TPR) repeat protein
MAQELIAPAREGLQAIPTPPLDSLEPVVAEQLRTARQELQAAVEKRAQGRELGNLYGALGRLYHAYEFLESAEPAYLNAVELSSGDVQWRHLLGALYQQVGRFGEAVDQFETIRRMDPTRREAAVRLGESLLQLNRLRDAREQFQEVLDVFPALARQGLGEIALREGRFDEAITLFGDVLERVPAATSVHYSLAMAYRGLGRLDEARGHLQRRGNGVVRVGDPLVDRLQALVHGERGLVLLGRRAYEAGQFADAADAFQRAVIAAPASPTSRINLGLALTQLGRAVEAAEEFDAALRLDPRNADAHAGLGMLLSGQGRDVEAVEHWQRAFEGGPPDAAVRDNLLRALVRLGRHDDAILALQRVRVTDPDDEATLLSLAILLADRRRLREAIDLLEDAIRRLPDRVAITTTLARLLASAPDATLRNGRRALDLATAVYESESSAVHAETVALALAELGRCQEALQWMQRGITAAEQLKNNEEIARLKSELPKYGLEMCRR